MHQYTADDAQLKLKLKSILKPDLTFCYLQMATTPQEASFYSDSVDTWADSVSILQHVLKPHSKAASIIVSG